MAAGVLHEAALAYQPLWNVQRQLAGVALVVDARPASVFDARHLTDLLAALWGPHAPGLMLGTTSPALLATLLDTTPPTRVQVVVPSRMLSDADMGQRVLRAQQRGLQLVWLGEPGQHPMPAFAPCFIQTILNLTPEDALLALQASHHRRQGSARRPGSRTGSPVRANRVYDGIASRVLAEHCLDEQGASALLGWPMEDVLHGHRQTRVQPGHRVVQETIGAIDAEASMDDIEQHLGNDPMLAYRFLRFVNSAGLGLRQEIDALRLGLMVLGLARTKSWLQDLLPLASHDLNLQPVRQTMVLRARFMAQLLDAGASEALHREVYLCGLLSQIDLLLFESMPVALRNIPVPARVKEALLSQTGPYWPYLAMAMSLETPLLATIRACCTEHGFDLHDVNLALLRTLANLRQTQ